MKIIKASAGSGKTYTLSKEFIELLVKSDDRYAYRHILAVTFTNKATAEMKSRILKDLASLARDDGKAKRILTDILHDYSAFSVSTIDRFFQQTIHAFVREIGRDASYQVELDKASLVSESMDRILDGLSENDKALISWLRESMFETISNGERFKIDDALYEIGMRLKSDAFTKLCDEYGIDGGKQFDRERLAGIRSAARKVIADFEKGAAGHGVDVGQGRPVKQPGVRKLKADPELGRLFEEHYSEYNTACIIDSLIFSLGLSGEFNKSYDALVKEKNVMSIDESNTFLKQIIDGSDAPFIYEKTGTRYDNFLLDEFQDTSDIQWRNFLPLLKESESRGGKNLVVGDVKQSIYRWRGSEWKLLGKEINAQFPSAEINTLDDNWRSTKAVVNFNSEFFKFAAGKLGLSDIYSDVHQGVKSDDGQCGNVRVTFTDDQVRAVVDSVASALEHGARQGDIAVLVRVGEQGSLVAENLIAAGYKVISDDSLMVKSSPVIRRLVSLLVNMDNPDNSVGSFLASSLNVEYPSAYHSLVDLCEKLLYEMKRNDPAVCEGQTLFIDAFLDDVQAWVKGNGNNLRGFLQHWSESRLCISSPEDTDAVRVITVHKSKGLEFPYTIFPFADSVTLYRHGVCWCHIDAGKSALGKASSGLYPVDLNSHAENSLFGQAYSDEKRMQTVDNLNVFYVAMTRASKSLHVIAGEPARGQLNDLKEGRDIEWKNLSQLLFAFVKGNYDFSSGTEYDFSIMKREAESCAVPLITSFNPVPLNGRIRPSEKASDYFGEDGAAGVDASYRLYGIALHDILSGINDIGDLDNAVYCAVQDGRLDRTAGAEACRMLRARISSHPEWFDAAASHFNEASVFAADGSEHRPDKVVVRGREAVVIDYKFGSPLRRHSDQVRGYMKLYSELGYEKVSGFVWYVPEDRTVEVQPAVTL